MMLQTLLSAFKRRHNAALEEAPVDEASNAASEPPHMTAIEVSRDKARFAQAKRRMVRKLWDMGFPYGAIVSTVNYYHEGRAERLEWVLSQELDPIPGALFYVWARAEPYAGTHAYAIWEMYRFAKEFPTLVIVRLGYDEYSAPKANALRKWGIADHELELWESESRRRKEDEELARLIKK